VRQIVLDTETTGLEVEQGHRIIEIGCVELVNRRLTGRRYHQYVNPQRAIDAGAESVHGIRSADLVDKPVFAQIAGDLLEFLGEADLVIHNAAFDLGFLNAELAQLGRKPASLDQGRRVIDTLALARRLHPGQKNNLDSLCRRYGVDNAHRELHGALLDAELLADVYLLMTGGQVALSFDSGEQTERSTGIRAHRKLGARPPLPRPRASAEELAAHTARLAAIAARGGRCLWPGETADLEDAGGSWARQGLALARQGGGDPR
jgi:DNA polymerase-3 subunit epsilon